MIRSKGEGGEKGREREATEEDEEGEKRKQRQKMDIKVTGKHGGKRGEDDRRKEDGKRG